MIKNLFYILLIAICPTTIMAQNSLAISGIVKDKIGILPGAAIYISGYKTSTITNNDGKFILSKLAPGNYDILVQMVGYIPYKKNIILENKDVYIEITLNEHTTLLNEVIVKPDPDRAYHIALFKDYFIGKTPNSLQCNLLNTQVLATNFDKSTKTLTVNSSEFLIIENKALGYRIKYHLEYFEYNFKTRVIYYAGLPFFEDLKGNSAKQKRWAKAREIAYKGSYHHFFKSLYENKITEEGFVINKIAKITNPFRKPDSIINLNIKKLTEGQLGSTKTLTFNGSDSLAYWLKQKNELKLVNTINKADVLVDTLAKVFSNDLKVMNFEDALYITYKNERETEAYRNSGNWQSRHPNVPNYQISVVSLVVPPALIYSNGGIFDPRSMLYQGYWAYEKMADIVPMDYLISTKN